MEHDATGSAQEPNLHATEHVAAIAEVAEQRQAILQEIKKVIVGQDAVIEELLIALLARGHCLLVGVPGLAKTLLISTLANVLHLRFNRIQFTPDLMPSDITGTDILEEDPETRHRQYRFLRGPIFANIVLADEINRTPPKTQAALLQAMQEYRLTAGGRTYELDLPFFVLATQNPIEQEGTYPLPEAQLDRFMFHIGIDYPSFDEEIAVVQNSTSAYAPDLQRVLSAAKILQLQRLVRSVPATRSVVGYAVQLAQRSRPNHPEAPAFIKEWVNWGAGPRASQYLVLGAKARAIMHGRFAASVDDVRALAPSVLRHRILTNFNAEAEGVSSFTIIQRLLEVVRPEAIDVALAS
ncbi:MAG: MoxR family ATPase [Candidatus Tectomicrobia bacterium]|uniref:MoxR family ATPase n=1 Tax=Tectimicrobiota bacterium TaxID=2528274 RepID=A0A938B5F7_UNCTE|nr:MoxR family ATPase [Candidatus Tectomicrobia bacterium]